MALTQAPLSMPLRPGGNRLGVQMTCPRSPSPEVGGGGCPACRKGNSLSATPLTPELRTVATCMRFAHKASIDLHQTQQRACCEGSSFLEKETEAQRGVSRQDHTEGEYRGQEFISQPWGSVFIASPCLQVAVPCPVPAEEVLHATTLYMGAKDAGRRAFF